jgi:hypothetical protein
LKVGKVGTLFAKEEQIVHWVLKMQHIAHWFICVVLEQLRFKVVEIM